MLFFPVWLNFTLVTSCVWGHRPVRLQVQSQALTTTSGWPFSSCLGLLGQLRIGEDSVLRERRALNSSCAVPECMPQLQTSLSPLLPNSQGLSKRTNKYGLQDHSMGTLEIQAKTTVLLPKWLIQRDLHSKGQDSSC